MCFWISDYTECFSRMGTHNSQWLNPGVLFNVVDHANLTVELPFSYANNNKYVGIEI